MKRKKQHNSYILTATLCLLAVIGIVTYALFSSVTKVDRQTYLYIDNDDNLDSVFVKLDTLTTGVGNSTISLLARHTSYSENIRTGRYLLEPGMSSLKFFRNLRNGHQEPVKLTIPSVRTKQKLAEELSSKLMLSSSEFIQALSDISVCEKYGLDTMTIISIFIPNTYEVYWNTPLEKFLDRMHKESDGFWNAERTKKADDLKLSPVEVITLASIVDEETANNGEKPMVAGMYYNRLQKGMPLQADPTIKFALQQFELRRIYTNLLNVVSPYNTYRNAGLPPGPIRIPSVAGIDAVLNLEHCDYLYMCAKEDFSGIHNFARTYPEHLINAAKYAKALNDRGIK